MMDRMVTPGRTLKLALCMLAAAAASCAKQSTPAAAVAAQGPHAGYAVRVEGPATIVVERDDLPAVRYEMRFVIGSAADDATLAMRPAKIEKINYNVVTWPDVNVAATQPTNLGKKTDTSRVAGDGFDDDILKGSTVGRTSDVFNSATFTTVEATGDFDGGTYGTTFHFPATRDGRLSVELGRSASADDAPTLRYTFTAARDGHFTVGYVGAPAVAAGEVTESFQPLVWQDKLFPERSMLTMAFQATVPTTLVHAGGRTYGVVVASKSFPFQPLPTLPNSNFGIALRDADGRARPMVFAPVVGAPGAKMKAGETFSIDLRLFVGTGRINDNFERVARELYGFSDFRRNATATLNQTLDNILAYGMSDFSRFREAMKGCAYDTDAPGTVKNVSSLNPIDMALVTDDEQMFDRRGYPYVEYMVSREKFLFTLDEKQKIQNPSYTLKGPCAPVSELASLYNLFGRGTPAFLSLAKDEYGKTRERNLDVTERGDSWQNALWMYRAGGDQRFLDAARKGADAYIAQRIATPQTSFNANGQPTPFFWTAYAPAFAPLFELYETTKNKKYLEAAHEAARRFTLYTWTAPSVPDANVKVNEGGFAPLYGYLKGKGMKALPMPEESVPAWRLSEIGLTPESSGTASGHRAIFMANYAPWLLRIAAATNDAFLHDVARNAVIGRYASFPGYHINTARTTAYEKADFPMRPWEQLSVNSFHFNHVWPMASMVLDYLVSDAATRSKGQIEFPSQFIEGYAYMQNKAYGGQVGTFYGQKDAVLWMPKGLLTSSSIQVNYVAARGDGRLYLALMNESNEAIETTITLSADKLPAVAGKTFTARVWRDGVVAESVQVVDGKAKIAISPRGLTALAVDGIDVRPAFQQKVMGLTADGAWREGFKKFGPFAGRAMVLNLGPTAKTIFAYLEDSKHDFKSVALRYTIDGGGPQTASDDAFPWEFTIKLPAEAKRVELQFVGTGDDGAAKESEKVVLSK